MKNLSKRLIKSDYYYLVSLSVMLTVIFFFGLKEFLNERHNDYLKELSSFTEENAKICVANNKFLGDNNCVDKILALAKAAGKKPYDREAVRKVLARVELNKFIKASSFKSIYGYHNDITVSYCNRSDEDTREILQEIMSVRQFKDINNAEVQAQVRQYMWALNCDSGDVGNAINYAITYSKLSKNKQT